MRMKENETERIKALLSFYVSDDNINLKTDVNSNDIKDISRIEYMNTYFKERLHIDLKLDKILKITKELRISKDRLGREEAVKVLSSVVPDKHQTSLDKLLNRNSI